MQQSLDTYTESDKNRFLEGEYHKVGTIPMVFALHGLGRDHKTMAGFVQGAEDYHFVLILPDGFNESWNAGSCCGDAQTLGLHDDDFLYQIQQELSAEFDFLQHQYSYGIGWDNGALLLTEALVSYPNLFRAIVPISGFSSRSWIPPSIGSGIGLMMHYSLDDLVMRPSGCCDDPKMPACQSDFKGETCVSILQSFDLWTRGVNLCDTGANDDLRTNDTNTILMGGEGDFLYSLFHKGGETSMELITAFDDEGEDSSSILTKSEVAMAITQKRDEYVCLTTTSSSCVATSTICVYRSMGHFDGFISTPFMSNHVMKFLASDVCSINGGLWNVLKSKNKKVCGCAANGYNGVFCLDEMGDDSIIKMTIAAPEQSLDPSALASSEESSSVGLPGWSILLMGALMTAAATIIFALSWRKYRKQSFSVHHNDNQAANILRGFNPYRDQFQVKTKDSDGQSGTHGMLSLPKVHEPMGQSTRSLDPNDIELLQFYRRRGSQDDSIVSRSEENAVECNFDKELLQSYRRREQMKSQYADDSSNASTSPKKGTTSVDDYLFTEIPSLSKDAPGIINRYADEHLKNYLWDE